ncbi:MAG: (4Fe-4S)-binding protein [Gemmatimonadales bacterium]
MPTRRQTYEADENTVTFDPDVCIHAGVCVGGLPDVFDITRKRWIRPELQPPDVVAAQVLKCPSDALQFVRKPKPH